MKGFSEKVMIWKDFQRRIPLRSIHILLHQRGTEVARHCQDDEQSAQQKMGCFRLQSLESSGMWRRVHPEPNLGPILEAYMDKLEGLMNQEPGVRECNTIKPRNTFSTEINAYVGRKRHSRRKKQEDRRGENCHFFLEMIIN